MSRVAVIGAGWSGLAAALSLARAGVAVDVFETAPQAGGRARGLSLEALGHTFRLDNGQHLLVGAYRHTIALITSLGLGGQLQARPMSLTSTAGLRLAVPRLPAPWHLAVGLLNSRGLSLAARWQLMRMMADLRWRGWTTGARTVQQLLSQQRQSGELTELIWRPLCIATMNTDIGRACAQTFVNVLRDTLGARRAASDFVVAQTDLGALLAEPAVAELVRLGSRIHWRHPVRELGAAPQTVTPWQVHGAFGTLEFEAVILAVPPANSVRLLDSAGAHEVALELGRFEYEPIATVYLWWPQSQLDRTPGVRLPTWIQLRESLEQRAYGQWLFDRGVQHGHRVAGVVVSAAARAMIRQGDAGGDRSHLASAVAAQVAAQLQLPEPAAAQTVIEKRATFVCAPDRPRLSAECLAESWPGIWLAGDHMWPEYPATLEAAVRSGQAAAAHCLRYLRAGSVRAERAADSLDLNPRPAR